MRHSRPQRDVRIDRHLRLEHDQVLDDLARRQPRPLEQVLAREERSIEGAIGDGLGIRSRRSGAPG
jgi:hypothetical protein